MIVADVALLADLLLRGARRAVADAVLRRDPDWNSPPLWRSEFRNVLLFYLRRDEINLEDALTFHFQAEELLGGRESQVSTQVVLGLAVRSGCTAYECEYVALAEALGVPLVTRDREVLAAFPGLAVSPEGFLRRGERS